jgi:hypothetical protein
LTQILKKLSLCLKNESAGKRLVMNGYSSKKWAESFKIYTIG